MPVRTMAQPLWFFFISAAWLGGAAVAMEARSRLAGDRGGAGQGRPSPGSRAPGPGRLGSLVGGPGLRGPPPALGRDRGQLCCLCRCCIPRGLRCWNGGAVPEDALWLSAPPAGLGIWERPQRVGFGCFAPHRISTAEPGSGRQQSGGCLPLLQAPDSSCHSSWGALAYSARLEPLGVFVCARVGGGTLVLCALRKGATVVQYRIRRTPEPWPVI